MDKDGNSLAEASDIYFMLRNFVDHEFPRLQFLRFSYNGWLMETINILASGEHELKLASEGWPLSVAPLDPMELEETWEGGEVIRSTALEFECIKNLVMRVDRK